MKSQLNTLYHYVNFNVVKSATDQMIGFCAFENEYHRLLAIAKILNILLLL